MEIYKDNLHNLIDSESYSMIKELPVAVSNTVSGLLDNVIDNILNENNLNLGKIASPHAKGVIYGVSENPNVVVTYYSRGLDVLKVAITDTVFKARYCNFETIELLLRNLPIIKELCNNINEEEKEEVLNDLEQIALEFGKQDFLSGYNTLQIMDLLEEDVIQPYMNNIAFKIQNFFELKFSEIYSIEEFSNYIVNTTHYKLFAKEVLISSKDITTPFIISDLCDDLLILFDIKYMSKNLDIFDVSNKTYKLYKNVIKGLERSVNLDGLNISDLEDLYVNTIATLCNDISITKSEQDIIVTLVKSCVLNNLLSSRKYLGCQVIEKSIFW